MGARRPPGVVGGWRVSFFRVRHPEVGAFDDRGPKWFGGRRKFSESQLGFALLEADPVAVEAHFDDPGVQLPELPLVDSEQAIVEAHDTGRPNGAPVPEGQNAVELVFAQERSVRVERRAWHSREAPIMFGDVVG